MDERIKGLREEAGKALQAAKDLTEKGDVDGAKQALQEHQTKAAEANALQEHVDQVATVEKASKDAEAEMRGRAPRAAAAAGADAMQSEATQETVQPLPGDEKPKGQDRKGRPFGWIEGLPASAQPKDILARASDALQGEAEAQYEAFIGVIRNGLPDPLVAQAMAETPEARRALQDLTTANAYTVPTALLPTPIDQLGERGKLGVLCEQRQVTDIKGSVPAFGSVTVGGYAETAAPAEQTPANVPVEYDLFAMGAYADITNKLLIGSAFDIIAAFSEAVARGMGRAIDSYILNGTGTNQFQGILDATVGIGVAAAARHTVAASAAITVADFEGMLALLGDQFHDNARIVTNVANMIKLRAGDFTANKGTSETGLFGPALGYPAIRSGSAGFEANGTAGNKLALVGDFANYVLFEQVGAPMLVSSASMITLATPVDGTRVAIRQYRDGAIARKTAFKSLGGKA